MMKWRAAILIFGILLCGGLSSAEPVYPDPSTNKAVGKSQPHPEKTLPLDTVDVTAPVASTDDEVHYFYRYDQELSFNTSLNFISQGDGSLPLFSGFGASYLWKSPGHFHFETGLEDTSAGEGHLWTVGRWVFNFTDKFRPYTSLGIGLRLRADRALANVVDISNYFLRGAAGLEYTLGDTISVRAEFCSGIDTQGRLLFGPTAGLAWGF